MKVLIISDTHGRNTNVKRVLERVGNIDLIIHLGDVEGAEQYIKEIAPCPMEIVSGNNDFFSDLEKEKEIEIGKYKIFMTHGHYFCVNAGIGTIKNEAISRGVHIVMFGHTHRPLIDVKDDITIINPGSLSYPRQEGQIPTYIILEIDRFGEAHFTLNYLE